MPGSKFEHSYWLKRDLDDEDIDAIRSRHFDDGLSEKQIHEELRHLGVNLKDIHYAIYYGYSKRTARKLYIRRKLREQNYCCAICGQRVALALDHDHQCCKDGCQHCWRSLLCITCNTGLGAFRDSIRLLSGAIVYLEDWGTSGKFRGQGAYMP